MEEIRAALVPHMGVVNMIPQYMKKMRALNARAL
jgi:hypothetical protein